MANTTLQNLDYYQIKAKLEEIKAKLSDFDNQCTAWSDDYTYDSNESWVTTSKQYTQGFECDHILDERLVPGEQLFATENTDPTNLFPEVESLVSTNSAELIEESQVVAMTQTGKSTAQAKPEKRIRIKSRVNGALFYFGCVALIFLAIVSTSGQGESGTPRHVGGFSAMRVLTGSMQSEIPRNSFIITRRVGVNSLRVGDDITFMVSDNSTVTHRIIVIIEDYNETGERGFQTQGIENPSADRTIVTPDNIVGRVIFSSLLIGNITLFISQNAIWIATFTALGIALIAFLKMFLFPKKAVENEIQHYSEPFFS